VAAARSGDFAQAVALLEPIANKGSGSARSTASRWLAHSLRAQGNCKLALRYYAPLANASSASPEVLREAADCYENVGDLKRAAELRARAQ
jgi:hypothetical protein